MQSKPPMDIPSNVHQLPVPHARLPFGADEAQDSGQVIRPDLWSESARIRNLSRAIRERFDGEVFLTTEQVAEVLHISVRTLSRISRTKLPRMALDGGTGNRYATCDIAAYYVRACDAAAALEMAIHSPAAAVASSP